MLFSGAIIHLNCELTQLAMVVGSLLFCWIVKNF
jgi:hypothetical protein